MASKIFTHLHTLTSLGNDQYQAGSPTGFSTEFTESDQDGSGNNNNIAVVSEILNDTGNSFDGHKFLGHYQGGIVTQFSGDYYLFTSNPLVNGTIFTANTTDFAICYLRGTRILTDRGEVAVEDLAEGDGIVTRSGAVRPLRWLGRQIVTVAGTPGAARKAPVRIMAGALGEGLPSRDLCVSPDHALCFGDALVPARLLVNDLSIVRTPEIATAEYFHVLLDSHDVIIAEGVAAESYVIHGNVGYFLNADAYRAKFGPAPEAWDADCLPRVQGGSVLEAARAQAFGRLDALGFLRERDPAPRLLADGREIALEAGEDGVLRATLPGAPAALRLVSRTVRPVDLGEGSQDRRRLGLPLRGLRLRAGGVVVTIAPDDVRLVEGFHPAEAAQRWTRGNAVLPAALFAGLPEGPVTVEIVVARPRLSYFAAPQAQQTRAA